MGMHWVVLWVGGWVGGRVLWNGGWVSGVGVVDGWVVGIVGGWVHMSVSVRMCTCGYGQCVHVMT